MNDDRLRTALFELGDVPPPPDLAGAALTHARRQRRRALTAAAAGLVAVLALAFGVPAAMQRHPLTAAAGRPSLLVSGYHYTGYVDGGPTVGSGTEVWDAARGRYVTVDPAYLLTPSPDGRWAAVELDSDPDRTGVVRIEDLAVRGPAAIRYPAGVLRAPIGAWSPDGRHLLTRDPADPRSPVLRIIDLPSMTVRTVTLRGAPELFAGEVQVQWAPDSAGLAAVRKASWTLTRSRPASYGKLVLFDRTGRATGSRPMPDADEFQFSPDGRQVLIGGRTYSTASPIDGDPERGLRSEPAWPVVYDFGTRRGTTIPKDDFTYVTRTASWYADGRVVSIVSAKHRTVVAIIDSGSGTVLSEREIGDPTRLYERVALMPLYGAPPPGALVL